MAIPLGNLEHIDPRTLWNNEATDFTPWLAENLPLLEKALGLDLEFVQAEQSVGGFSCDIVARESNNSRPVIIENQLEATDHRHLGQLLTYAGGLDAAIVVWISPSVREEHRQALDWLNQHTDDQIDFFAVVLEAVRIDASNPAIQFRPVAFPNEWRRRSITKRTETTELGSAYRDFFQKLVDDLREIHKFTNSKVALPKAWYSFALGFTNITYGANFAGRNRIQVELYIQTEDVAKNKAIFNWLQDRTTQIELQLGEKLVWELLPNRRASRISLARLNTIADVKTQGDDMRHWLIDRLLRFKKVFGPLLPEALAASETVIALESAASVSQV